VAATRQVFEATMKSSSKLMEAARSGDISQKAETQMGIPWNEN
jgi:hypothetical protein